MFNPQPSTCRKSPLAQGKSSEWRNFVGLLEVVTPGVIYSSPPTHSVMISPAYNYIVGCEPVTKEEKYPIPADGWEYRCVVCGTVHMKEQAEAVLTDLDGSKKQAEVAASNAQNAAVQWRDRALLLEGREAAAMAEAGKLRAEVVRIRGGCVDASGSMSEDAPASVDVVYFSTEEAAGLKSVLACKGLGPESDLTERGIGEDHWLDGGRLKHSECSSVSVCMWRCRSRGKRHHHLADVGCVRRHHAE